MHRKLLSFILLFSTTLIVSAQITPTTQWTWVSGNNILDQPGIYGTQGSFDPSNLPGSRDALVSWTDESGNFWIYGGSGYASVGRGLLNDLWKYDPMTNQWMWVSGSTSVNDDGDMGIKGVSSPSNLPGARKYSSSWIDNNGKLWLFGGEGYMPSGYGFLNDLWMFDPATSQWTWIGGSDVPDEFTEFGSMGISDPSNMPGSRTKGGTWTDQSGNLWLFGGLSYDGMTPAYSNELWRYEISTNLWTWMAGSFILNSPGIYGTQGVPSVTNAPGGRQDIACWYDNTGKLWMLGGFGLDLNGGEGAMNDLWSYNIGTNTWTWMKGDNVVNQAGIYGTVGVSGPTTTPGGRFQAYSWKDPFGTFWLYGGDGYGTGTQGLLSDLWKYETGTNRWTWVKGDGVINRSSVYGTQGVADAGNRPGGRRGGAAFPDPSGNLWLFGGNGYDATTNTDLLNDLWRLGSFAPVPVKELVLTAALRNNRSELRWITRDEFNTSNFLIERSQNGRDYIALGTRAASGFTHGQTNYNFTDNDPSGINYYRLKLTDRDGSVTISNIAFVKINDQFQVDVYPNPANDIINITSGEIQGRSTVFILDNSGRMVIKAFMEWSRGAVLKIDVSGLTAGRYNVVIQAADKTLNGGFIRLP